MMSISFSKIVVISGVTFLGACKLSVSTMGEGTVESNDGVIDCGEVCSVAYSENQTIELTQTPAEGFYFSAWEGCNSEEDGICIASVGPWINKSVTAVFKPDFNGRVYQLDFEAPLHEAGFPPAWGPAPDRVPYYIPRNAFDNYVLKVDNTYPQMSGQALEFRPLLSGVSPTSYSMVLPVKFGAPKYRIAMDVMLENINLTGVSRILFGSNGNGTAIEFVDSNVRSTGGGQALYEDGVPFHLEVMLDIVQQQFSFYQNGELVRDSIPLRSYSTEDLTAVEFEFARNQGVMVLDNIVIEGVWNRDFQLDEPETEEGNYVVDFNFPVITSTNGYDTSSIYRPFKENGFVIGARRYDASIAGNPYTNGSVYVWQGGSLHLGYIYHENGYSFGLKSFDLWKLDRHELTIIGYKRNGDEITRTLAEDEVFSNFETVEFGEEWTDLDSIWIGRGNYYRFDNVVLSITREESKLKAEY